MTVLGHNTEESFRIACSLLYQAERKAELEGVAIIDNYDGSSDYIMTVHRGGKFEYGLFTGQMDDISRHRAVEVLASFHEDSRLRAKMKSNKKKARQITTSGSTIQQACEDILKWRLANPEETGAIVETEDSVYFLPSEGCYKGVKGEAIFDEILLSQNEEEE